MFDISFSEIVLIAVIALIVLGPERLPKVARTLGHLWGRAQRYVNGVKADIARDMAVEEFLQMQRKVQQQAESAQQAAKQMAQSAERQAREIGGEVKTALQEPAPSQAQLELQPLEAQKKIPPLD